MLSRPASLGPELTRELISRNRSAAGFSSLAKTCIRPGCSTTKMRLLPSPAWVRKTGLVRSRSANTRRISISGADSCATAERAVPASAHTTMPTSELQTRWVAKRCHSRAMFPQCLIRFVTSAVHKFANHHTEVIRGRLSTKRASEASTHLLSGLFAAPAAVSSAFSCPSSY